MVEPIRPEERPSSADRKSRTEAGRKDKPRKNSAGNQVTKGSLRLSAQMMDRYKKLSAAAQNDAVPNRDHQPA